MKRKHALLIGTKLYDNSNLRNLDAPGADMEALGNVLRDRCGFQVELLLDQTAAELREAVSRFFDARQRNDVALLYYTGHGILDDKGQLHLCARDTNPGLPRAKSLPSNYIQEEMDNSLAESQVVILDCCNGGSFKRGVAKSGLGESLHLGDVFEGRSRGRVVLVGSDTRQYAFENEVIQGDGMRSLFTHHLVEGLATGAADSDKNGEITIQELFDYAKAKVQEANPSQQPKWWVFKESHVVMCLANVDERSEPVGNDHEVTTPSTVHREDEWNLIRQEIQKRITTPTLEHSVILFHGMAGLGKSVFLRETLLPRLAEEFPHLPLTLVNPDEEGLEADSENREDFAIHLFNGLVGDDEPIRSEDEVVALLTSKIIPELKNKNSPPLVILDSVERFDEGFIQWVQTSLQEPTIKSGYILWIMFSRRDIACFFVQPYLEKEQLYLSQEFKPFTRQLVERQVPKHKELIDELMDFGQGMPELTPVLTREMDIIKQSGLHGHSIKDYIHNNAHLLASPLYQKLQDQRYLGNIDELARHSIRVLSPWRHIDMGVITLFLKPHLARDGVTQIEVSKELIVRRLLSAGLLRAIDPMRKSYTFEEPLRRVIARILRAENPDLFEAIINRAHERYMGLWESRRKVFDLQEAFYYQAIILKQLKESKDAVDRLYGWLRDTLQEFPPQELGSIRDLENGIRSDSTIKELFPRSSDLSWILKALEDYKASVEAASS